MSKYLDNNGLLYLWGKIKALVNTKVTAVTGKQLSTNDYTDTEKNKLAGIAAGANAYAHPAGDGNQHIPATGTGNNGKFLRAGATAGSAAWGGLTKAEITALGIPGSDTTYGAATSSAPGLMSAADKSKLDGVAAGANAYTHPAYTAKASGLYKVTVDASGHVSAAAAVAKADITALGIPASNTTYAAATGSTAGLMPAADKAKLDGFSAASAYALKSDITSMYRYKGSVAAVANLPSSGNTTGDVYDVQASGANYAWNGTAWDALGGTFAVDAITNAEIDAVVAS